MFHTLLPSNVTYICVQLFEKLRLQNPGAHEVVKKQEVQEKADEPKETPKSCSNRPAHTGDDRTAESKETESVPNTQGTKTVSQAPQKYGKVHTRHINQLFIRGENIILVNPQPL